MQGRAVMLCRFGSVLGRFSVSPSRGVFVQTSRALSATPVLRRNDTPALPKPATAKRGGLTGFLQDKTGVTGAWTLGLGVGAFLVGSELYVINSETVTAAVIGGVVYWLMKTIGPQTAQYLDSRSQQIFNLLNEGKLRKIQSLENALEAEKSVEGTLTARHEMFEILSENNTLRMEEEYRRRLNEVTNEVKKRLDYQVDVEQVERKFQQQQMIQWLEKEVTEAVMAKQDESLAQCMTELRKMATA